MVPHIFSRCCCEEVAVANLAASVTSTFIENESFLQIHHSFGVIHSCRTAAAAEGGEPGLDGAHAQQASDAGGHLQGVSALQRQRTRGHRHGPARPGGAGLEELAEPPGWV